jgi:uncharacterized protein YndB with AHSA1/START domain
MAAPPGELTLEMTRVVRASPPQVFAAFSDADQLAGWWGPKGFTIPSLEFDPRPGASYRITMQPPEGDRFDLTGEFREVDPPARLCFTFVWEEPDPDDVETLVRLSFRGAGSSTEVGLEHGRFMTEQRRALHRDGWTDSFDKLERLVSSHSQPGSCMKQPRPRASLGGSRRRACQHVAPLVPEDLPEDRYESLSGRTSTAPPSRAAGIRDASSIAASRSSAS